MQLEFHNELEAWKNAFFSRNASLLDSRSLAPTLEPLGGDRREVSKNAQYFHAIAAITNARFAKRNPPSITWKDIRSNRFESACSPQISKR